MKALFQLVIIGLTISATFMLAACEKESPVEKVGKQIDQSLEEAKADLRQVQERIEDSVEPRGPSEKVNETVADSLQDAQQQAEKTKKEATE